MNTRKLLTALTITAASVAVGAGISHADTSQGTDACRDGGTTTIIVGMRCGPDTPTVSQVCANGWAHTTIGDHDYCPQPKVVTVGESELGTLFVPRIFPGTRLDVAMRRTSLVSMRFRCARLGGSRLVASHGFQVCRGVTVVV